MSQDAEGRSFSRIGLIALVAFLGIRLSLALLTVRDPKGGVLLDSGDYLYMASQLRQVGNLQDPIASDVSLVHPPGYAAYLAGIEFAIGKSFPAITLSQLLLTGLSALLLVWIGREVGHIRLGLLAGWILAMSPNVALWSLTVMSETLFCTFLVLGLALWIRATNSGDAAATLGAALTIGCSALIRPTALVLFPIWAGMTWYDIRSRHASRQALILTGLFVAVVGLVVTAWMARNLDQKGQFTFTTVGAKTLVGFNLADVLARGEGITRDDAAGQLQMEGPLQQTLLIVRRYPVPFMRAQLLGLARTASGTDIGTWGNVLDWDHWSGLGMLTGLLGQAPAEDHSAPPETPLEAIIRGGLLAYSLLFAMTLLLSSLIGAIRVWGERGNVRGLMLLSTLSAIALIVTPLAAGQARFRVPAEPFLGILAAYGAVGAITGFNRWKQGTVASEEGGDDAAKETQIIPGSLVIEPTND